MLCASTYAAVATAIALGIAVAALNVILVLSVLGGGWTTAVIACIRSQHHTDIDGQFCRIACMGLAGALGQRWPPPDGSGMSRTSSCVWGRRRDAGGDAGLHQCGAVCWRLHRRLHSLYARPGCALMVAMACKDYITGTLQI